VSTREEVGIDGGLGNEVENETMGHIGVDGWMVGCVTAQPNAPLGVKERGIVDRFRMEGCRDRG
jgi:hypothetical protein